VGAGDGCFIGCETGLGSTTCRSRGMPAERRLPCDNTILAKGVVALDFTVVNNASLWGFSNWATRENRDKSMNVMSLK